MSRRLLSSAIGVTALALTALLIYSLERTAWLFGRFEVWEPAAYAAAGVVELAAVALIVGASALAGLAPAARAWSNRALLAVLSVGALANLSAGYLRGGAATLAAFGGDWAAYAVAAALWLCTNLAVPGLILCLSKLLEQLIIAHACARANDPAAEIAQLRTALADATHEAAHLEADRARIADEAARRDADTALAEADIAQLRESAARQAREYAAALREKDQELAQLRESAAQPIAIDGIDLLAVARKLRNGGVSLRETAELIGQPESTLRSRLKATNGHKEHP